MISYKNASSCEEFQLIQNPDIISASKAKEEEKDKNEKDKVINSINILLT